MLRTRQPIKKTETMKKNRVTATPKARKKVTHLDFGNTVGDCNKKNFEIF